MMHHAVVHHKINYAVHGHANTYPFDGTQHKRTCRNQNNCNAGKRHRLQVVALKKPRFLHDATNQLFLKKSFSQPTKNT